MVRTAGRRRSGGEASSGPPATSLFNPLRQLVVMRQGMPPEIRLAVAGLNLYPSERAVHSAGGPTAEVPWSTQVCVWSWSTDGQARFAWEGGAWGTSKSSYAPKSVKEPLGVFTGPDEIGRRIASP